MGSRLSAAVAAFGILAGAFFSISGAEKLPANVGRRVADFTLKDTQGRTVSLSDFKNKSAVVVVFTGTECVIQQRVYASAGRVV